MTQTIVLAIAACVVAVPASSYPACPGMCPPFAPCEWPAPPPFFRPAPHDACCGFLRDALADELLYRALLLRRPAASLPEAGLPARLPPRRRHAEARGLLDAPQQQRVPMPSVEEDLFDQLVSERGPRADASSEPENTSRAADDNNHPSPPSYQMWEPYSRYGLAVPSKWELQKDAPLAKDPGSLPEDLGRHDRVQVESVWPHPSFTRRAEVLVDASRGAVSTAAASEDAPAPPPAGRPGAAPPPRQAGARDLAGALFDKAFNFYPDQLYKSRFAL